MELSKWILSPNIWIAEQISCGLKCVKSVGVCQGRLVHNIMHYDTYYCSRTLDREKCLYLVLIFVEVWPLCCSNVNTYYWNVTPWCCSNENTYYWSFFASNCIVSPFKLHKYVLWSYNLGIVLFFSLIISIGNCKRPKCTCCMLHLRRWFDMFSFMIHRVTLFICSLKIYVVISWELFSCDCHC